jgi:hypothetical protein
VIARLVLAAVLLASPALAQTSEEYAHMATKTFSAWSCSVLADYGDKNGETERLFKLGYDTGKNVIEALWAGKVNKEDWSKHAPWVFGHKLGGPSTDFALGRLFETILDDKVEKLWKKSTDNEARKREAESMYRTQNCSFLK